jgi:cell wall-associated NlpC family hydrolase
MTLRGILASVFVAAVMTMSLPAAALAGPVKAPGPAKSTPAQPEPKGSRHAARTKPPAVPAKAETVLRRLLKAAALVSTDDEQAALLSERYDVATYELAKARRKVSVLDRQVRVTDGRLSSTGARLRGVAVVAYVAGELSNVDSNVLVDNPSEGQMAEVYSGVALGQLRRALTRYEAASGAVHAARATAFANTTRIAATVVEVATLRSQARSLMRKAASQYALVSRKLRRLVGRKEFEKLLLSPWPAASPYKGPDLAGTDVSRVATASQGLQVAAASLKFVGVPYVFGGAGKAGVDCSGLTMLAWAKAGYSLAHSATLQWEQSQPVPVEDLEPGDLLFYHFSHDGPGAISHVVMYIGSGPFGVETVVQAAEPGTSVAVGKLIFSGLVGAGRP